jgi:hypothetical protein
MREEEKERTREEEMARRVHARSIYRKERENLDGVLFHVMVDGVLFI